MSITVLDSQGVERTVQTVNDLIAVIGEVDANPTANTVLARLKALLAGPVPVSDNSGSLTVDGTVAATQSGTWSIGTVSTITNPVTVMQSGSVSVTDGGGSLTVDGTVAVSGTVTVGDGSGSLTVDGTVNAAQSGTWNITNVSGTVSLPTGAATETTLSTIAGRLPTTVSGGLPVNVVAGSSAGQQYTEGDTDATISGFATMWEDTGNTLRSVSAATPFPVTIVSGSSSGTQYTEGATSGAIVGTALMWEDTSDTLRSVSAAKPLPVNVISGSTSGTEYTEGDVDATITGRALMLEGAGNALVAAPGTATDGLLVNLGANNDVTVTSSALPSGAATAANQSTLNTNLGTTADAKVTDPDTNGTLIAYAKGTIYQLQQGVFGGVASGAADSGNPVKVGGRYNSSPPTLTNGQRGDLQLDANGRTLTAAAQSGAWNVTNISGTVSLPTGASTSALQTTANTTLSGIASSLSGGLTVTNAGTFAVQLTSAGGLTDLSGAAASLAVLDDWDETDRCKVNPIAGQAGVASGTGVVGATTQRVTIATDDTPIAGLNTLITSTNTKLDTINSTLGTPLASEVHVGQIGGTTTIVDVTLSLDTSAYAANDVLADTQVVTNLMRVNDGTGLIDSLMVIDKDDNGQEIDFYFLDANVSMGTENAAASISDANAASILGKMYIESTDYDDLGGVRVGMAKFETGRGPFALKPASGTRNVYLAAILRSGTPTYTASGVVCRVGVSND